MTEIIFVIITWYGLAGTLEQELPTDGWSDCDKQMMHMHEVYTKARDADPLFGFIVECKKKERAVDERKKS